MINFYWIIQATTKAIYLNNFKEYLEKQFNKLKNQNYD